MTNNNNIINDDDKTNEIDIHTKEGNDYIYFNTYR